MGNYKGDNVLQASAFITKPDVLLPVGTDSSSSVICTGVSKVLFNDGTLISYPVKTLAQVYNAPSGCITFDRTKGKWIVFTCLDNPILMVGREADIFSFGAQLNSDFAVAGRVLYDSVVEYQYMLA